MADHPTLLTRLIISSEACLQMRTTADRQAVIDIAEEIEAEARRPSDGPRVIGDEISLCAQALLHADRHLRSLSRSNARAFCQVIGVLLPDARAALEIAIEQRKRPSP